MSTRFAQPKDATPLRAQVAERINALIPRKFFARHTKRAKNWFYGDPHGRRHIEFLLPQLRRETVIGPFSFEKKERLTASEDALRAEAGKLDPWVYRFELGDFVTKPSRDDTDWLYHRYRSSLLIGTIMDLLGDRAAKASVIDVACHCGPFALELKERGVGTVRGVDLRENNIAQAKFLAKAFNVPGVEFDVLNVRELSTLPKVDVAFCGGLLYHVTFPLELMRDLHDACTDFLVLDTVAHREPISSFHLVCNKPVAYSAEGEAHYEFQPTYRAVIDGLRAVGFKHLVEIVGDRAADVPGYRDGVVRSIVAFKEDGPTFARVRDSLPK